MGVSSEIVPWIVPAEKVYRVQKRILFWLVVDCLDVFRFRVFYVEELLLWLFCSLLLLVLFW